MHERCFGWAFTLPRKVSMLETAVWKTSEGRSYQTLRHLNTCADPSLMPGEILEVSEENREVCGKPLLGTSAGKMWEFFPSRGSPPPVWECHVFERKNYGLFCILGPSCFMFGYTSNAARGKRLQGRSLFLINRGLIKASS